MKGRICNKRAAAAVLCIALAGAQGLGMARTAYAAGYEKVDGSYRTEDGTVIDQVTARGIDVSRWQTTIDWKAVAADDVQFVMLGTRSQGAVDPYFHTNVKGASDAGIRVGAYIYSTASTTQMAEAEADFVLDLVRDYPISFPIAFDAEDSSTLGSLPPAQASEVINAFCKRIADAGYYPIVYANDNWLNNKIDMSTMHYDVWVARYGKKHMYAEPIMWQSTNSGSVNGIKGNVDINFLYKDLTPYLPGNLWRTIGGKTYYYKDYVIQKDAWIQDETGWFYMDKDGLASKGWLTKAGLSYYLDGDSGRMVTGWKELDGKQYYFNASGVMAAGWVSPDGSWYYLDAQGHMAQKWITVEGKTYYLNETSGKMATDWQEIDGAWYYLGGSGAMVTGLTDIGGKLYYLNPADGKMAVSTVLDFDGVEYTADENGVCTMLEETAEVNESSENGGKTPDGKSAPAGGDGPTPELVAPGSSPVEESSLSGGGPGM